MTNALPQRKPMPMTIAQVTLAIRVALCVSFREDDSPQFHPRLSKKKCEEIVQNVGCNLRDLLRAAQANNHHGQILGFLRHNQTTLSGTIDARELIEHDLGLKNLAKSGIENVRERPSTSLCRYRLGRIYRSPLHHLSRSNTRPFPRAGNWPRFLF